MPDLVDLSQFEQVATQLERLVESERRPIVLQAASLTMEKLDSIVKDKYPPNVRRLKVYQFFTEKQKRWWWFVMTQLALESGAASAVRKAVKAANKSGDVNDPNLAQTRFRLTARRAVLAPEVRQAFIGYKVTYKRVEGRRVLDIQGSYKRTNTLVRSLTYEDRSTEGGVEFVYGSNNPAAKYVIGKPPDQSKYHEDNWEPLEDIFDAALPELVDFYALQISMLIDKKLGVNL